MQKRTDTVTDKNDETPFMTIASDTLMGDLRDFILDRLQHEHNPLPWQMRGEAQQKETIDRVTSAMRTWVNRAVTLIAAQGQRAARGQLIKFQAKDGIQMQINLAASEPLRHDLMDNVGATVLITIADVEQFQGERSAPKVIPDQARMNVDPPDEDGQSV
jgi:hypothetical protein